MAGRFQGWARRTSAAAAPGAVVLGFLLRLTIIAAVLIVIGLTTPLDMLALGLAFVCLFTLLNIWSIYRLLSKNPPSPPSTGVNR